MEAVYLSAESLLRYIVEFSTLLLELFGICILVFTAVKSFIFWLKKDESIRLELAQGIALALEFKLGGRCSGRWSSGNGRSWVFWGPSSLCVRR